MLHRISQSLKHYFKQVKLLVIIYHVINIIYNNIILNKYLLEKLNLNYQEKNSKRYLQKKLKMKNNNKENKVKNLYCLN